MASWSDGLEKLFKKSAEHFLCLRWAHDAAQRYCATRNTWLSLPVIMLSGLAGLGSVGSNTLLPFHGSEILVGLISFSAGTLQTISSYFAFAKRAEAHRIAALSYEKLYRMLDFQLKIDRPHRTDPTTLITQLKEEADRLNEVSPQLPNFAIDLFKQKFGDVKDVAIPAILNGLEAVEVAPPELVVETPEPRIRITLQERIAV
jgi:hypothetical protein